MGMNLSQVQALKLKLTPAVYQAISLLQYNTQDLTKLIHEQAEINPFLSIHDWSGSSSMYGVGSHGMNNSTSTTDVIEQTIANGSGFREELRSQIQVMSLSPEVQKTCFLIIDSLNDNGYFEEDMLTLSHALRVPIKQLENALSIVRTLDPPGIGAKSLKDCLSLQLKRQTNHSTFAMDIVTHYIDCFITGEWVRAKEALDMSDEELHDALQDIRALNPTPIVSGLETRDAKRYIIPDIYITKEGHELKINDEMGQIPNVSIDSNYVDELKGHTDPETNHYLKEKLKEAEWLLMGITKRKQTLIKLTELCVNYQRAFFESGKWESIQPLTMKKIAEQLEVHESTISRAVSNKYIQAPFGIVSYRSLFSKGLSSSDGEVSVFYIKSLIQKIITNEDKSKPLSDRKIVEALNDKGITLSRRVVSKYRTECGYLAASKRKIVKKKQD
ncbi:RNA polymerase factor sigma-54 [Terrilactibacillus sp. BCM23-1]|uniref:RNA polymerase factor sigma-54 n=1 Tax=Terrilactibacillus tamarindi TaxID=2599694 RepID=A0A6N8CLJ8_9BACI|nr:RNA polymerase factor sigma-54 [Terrilactibacillus tamarindi]MTT30809.1 RNA polymerase factor sigma-54 [Terrilactibacillus tamarindi]